MYKETEGERLFLQVLSDLEEYLPYLVLVGGWVPFLYARYLWHIRQRPARTVDIDFGFGKVPPKKLGRPLARKLAALGYGEHHERLNRLYPYVPIAQSPDGKLKFDVEFITGAQTTEALKEALLGREIKINRIDQFEILLEDTMGLDLAVKSKPLQAILPTPETFCFHKLLTFASRRGLDKKKKDLHYAYYILRFHPHPEDLMKALATKHQKKSECQVVLKNVRKYFTDEFSDGPRMIEAVHGSDDFIPNVRVDAYKRSEALLKVLIA